MMMKIILIESTSCLCRISYILNLNPEFITDSKPNSFANRIRKLGNYNGNLEYILDSIYIEHNIIRNKSIDLKFTLNQIIRK